MAFYVEKSATRKSNFLYQNAEDRKYCMDHQVLYYTLFDRRAVQHCTSVCTWVCTWVWHGCGMGTKVAFLPSFSPHLGVPHQASDVCHFRRCPFCSGCAAAGFD